MKVRLMLAGLVAAGFSMTAVPAQAGPLDRVDHFVVLIQENSSFDKSFGGWEKVDGLPQPGTQVDQNGAPLNCLLQTYAPLKAPPLSAQCSGSLANGSAFSSHFGAGTFRLNDFVSQSTEEPEGIRHGFYQERYQVHDGAMDRFVVGNDESAGLAMGMWDTKQLPLYKYLHKSSAPNYVIADKFFHAAYGGSFLNHQWLIASRTPTWSSPPEEQRSVVDANGMPGTYPAFPLYSSPSSEKLRSGVVTAKCNGLAVPCGDYAVNTVQPPYQPYAPGASTRLPAQTGATIGSRMSKAGVSWGWYAQGWSNAAGLRGKPGWTNGKSSCTASDTAPGAVFPYCPSVKFQYHHQAFNYRKAFSADTSKGKKNRKKYLRDYVQFQSTVDDSARKCTLRDVSFVKFMSGDSEHPGGGGPKAGSKESVKLIKSVVGSACAKNTMIIVIYDENGGAWDHVAPPPATSGPSDQWGPGTRIPALIVAPGLGQKFAVDSVSHDTTSVTKTLEERFGLKSLGERDKKVESLASVWNAK